MRTKWILIILKSLIQVILDSLKEMEKDGNKDPDGFPLTDEYDMQNYIVHRLSAIVLYVEANNKEHEK